MKIIRAYKLRKLDFFGKSDPYVKLKLSDEKLPSKKTSVKHSNLDPEWNEEFKFVIKDAENQVVELNVYDWEKACNFHDTFVSYHIFHRVLSVCLFITSLDVCYYVYAYDFRWVNMKEWA